MAIVDIAAPCYRYGRFLQDCVSSVLSQSISDVRILIIDDASQDGSADVARALAATDPRIELSVHQTNLGQTATYNEGIAWATAPYPACPTPATDARPGRKS
ncbi:glycosyltransferase [Chelatococcus sambhunathii]|uniref:Glycosyltransferase n=2 Tax=Chelatococcus sambhunathii TaxID=363953 RepID=A0ABU1DHV1_9HYPH|nr:glycosyltransferase [Chelatococcus sambhunathii]